MLIVINRTAIKIIAGMLLQSIGCSAVAFAIATGRTYDLGAEFGIMAVSLALYLIGLKVGGRIVRTHGGPLASFSISAVNCAVMTTILVLYSVGWIPLVAAVFYGYLAIQYFRLALRYVAAAKRRP